MPPFAITHSEAKWIAQGIEELPWWKSARDKDEIATPEIHPLAETFDGSQLGDERALCTFVQFIELFEWCSGHAIEDFASPLKTPRLVQGRVELTLLGVSRFGFRASDIASLVNKHPSSMTRWINQGLLQEREDPAFRYRINILDQQISAAAGAGQQ